MNKTLTKQRNIRKPAGFETKEMEGYFRLPKKAAAIAIVKKLSGTQLRLWLYLMMEDPFADLTATGEKIYHYIPSPVEIALKIGANQETVEKDMRVLKKLGLYDYRATGWEGYNLSAAEADAEADRLRQRKKATEILTAKGGGLNNPQESLNKPPERLNSLLETPEPLPQADSKTPQTIQTSSDLNQTLSEGKTGFSQFWAGLVEEERERFEAYCKAVTANYQKPVVRIKDWLASTDKAGESRWESLYKEFKASEAAAIPASDEASQAEQQKLANRRKQAQEFLSERNTDPDRDKKCVPAPQKSAAQPQETVEEPEVSNQLEEGAKEPKIEGKGFGVDQKLIKRLKAKSKKSPKQVTKEVVEDDRVNDAAPYD